MACPPKFNDLHKAVDDCFNKDYYHGFFNLKLGQNYRAGTWGDGTITSKWNFNQATANSNTSVEFKHNNNYSAFPGSVTTKTINVETGILTYKHELPFNGYKIIVSNDYDTGDNWSVKNNSLELQTGRNQISASLKLNQLGGITKMLDSVGANAVVGLNKCVKLAGDVNYNIKKGSLDHHFKLVSGCPGAIVALNLKNAVDTELVISKKVDKNIGCCPNASFKMNNFHAKAQYGIKSSDYGCQFGVEGKWNCGGWSTQKTTATWDCKANDFKYSDHMKITNNFTGIFSVKTNFNDGFFKKCSVGAAFEFNA